MIVLQSFKNVLHNLCTYRLKTELSSHNMSLQSLKLVTFDATNTLLKFKVPPWQYYAIVASKYGFDGTVDDLQKNLKHNLKIMGAKHPNFGRNTLGWEFWWRQIVHMTLKDYMPVTANLDEIADEIINDFRTNVCWSTADGAEEAIDQFKRLGFTVGVISNFDPRLHDVLKALHLRKLLDFVITSYDVGYSKPDERIFQDAINSCKRVVKPSEALHVGDDIEKDYEGARAAGWHAILINPNLSKDTPLAPDHLFRSLKEFSAIIDQQSLKL